MPNKTINDDNVKWPSKRKYNCKKNKGEHEWRELEIKSKSIRYIHKGENGGILLSNELHPEYKFLYAEVSIMAETRCKHCNKKSLSFLSDKI